MSNKKAVWDGRFSNLKISETAYPELHRELSQMHHRERGDRLRSLAMIGLCFLHNLGQNGVPHGLSANSAAQQDSEQEKPEATLKLEKAKSQLREKLLGSLDSVG